MDINTIDTMIKELSAQDLTYTNCRNLAALYTLRDHLTDNEIEKEYNDILPEYQKYREIKTKYQMNKLPEDAVTESIKSVCQEIYEFIRIIYTSTDTNKERTEIRKLIEKLKIATKR